MILSGVNSLEYVVYGFRGRRRFRETRCQMEIYTTATLYAVTSGNQLLRMVRSDFMSLEPLICERLPMWS